jgi:N-acetylglutamate synthase
MKFKVAEMTLDRHAELLEFWKNTAGIWVSDDDSYENLKIFLKRNPKSNFIVLEENKIIGTVKCSHDGRRGYIHHLAVKEGHRKQGIAKGLVERCLATLKKQGINKYRVFVLDSNPEAIKFWKHMGFEEQVYDYRTLQKDITD